jgi:hypothetical protein
MESTLGALHPDLLDALETLAEVLTKTHHVIEANTLKERSKEIRSKYTTSATTSVPIR